MMREEKTMLIVNPAAGYNTGRKIYPGIYNSLKETFKNIDLRLSEKPGSSIEIAQNAAQNGYDLLIALGGDGTSYEVLNGIMKYPGKKPMLSFIPSGSGNSFLRDFDISSPEQAVKRIADGKKHSIDVIKYEYSSEAGRKTSYFLNILGVGFVARVAALRLKYFRLFRSFGYTIGVLAELVPLKRDKVKLVADGKEYALENNFISISNSRFTGGKMMMAPSAILDDGKMDIVMLNDAGRMKMLKSFPKIFDGTHISLENVKVLQAKKAEIKSVDGMPILVDGEVIGFTPLSAEVLPGVLEVLL
jgi:diacylglycerol kinase (ATP)